MGSSMKPSKCRQRLAATILAVQLFAINETHADEVDEFTLLLYEGYAETFIQGTDDIVRYQIVDGLAIMEGDIVLGEHEHVQTYGIPGFTVKSPPPAEADESGEIRSLWPNGKVPYAIDDDLPHGYVDDIKTAIRWIESAANVHFVEHTTENDYVEFYRGSGCNSMVGRNGGKQHISLGSMGCAKPGVIAHELLHTLGFWHEQSRADRNQYITVNWSNVQSGTEYNFQKASEPTTADNPRPYDYTSIMHYRYSAFSANGLPTITAKDPDVDHTQIGQRKHLSKLDKSNLVKLYGSKKSGDDVKLSSASGTQKNLSVKTGEWIFFEVQVPRDQTLLSAQISGGKGDADLYISLEAKPDVSNYDCRSYMYGNAEECTVNLPLSGTWFIGIYGDNSSSDLTFQWQVK